MEDSDRPSLSRQVGQRMQLASLRASLAQLELRWRGGRGEMWGGDTLCLEEWGREMVVGAEGCGFRTNI